MSIHTCGCLANPNLDREKDDNLFHIGLKSKSKEVKEIFGDAKFVCMGGSANRMLHAAQMAADHLRDVIGQTEPTVNHFTTDRYVCYKVGPVLFINHGIGINSMTVVLNEILKALFYTNAPIVCLVRIGTSGGIGVKPGTVVLTSEALDGLFKTYFEIPILGTLVKKVSKFDRNINQKILECKRAEDDFDVVEGKTLSAWDFYEGQGRLDGFFCDYTEADKFEFLKKLKANGACNIEMEALCLGAMAVQANISAVVACVTLLDRFQGDSMTTPHEVHAEWEQRPIRLVVEMIRRHLLAGKPM